MFLNSEPTPFMFTHPANCVVAGPSQSGKTSFIINLIKHRENLIEDCPKKIVLFYNEALQDKYKELVNEGVISALQGLPSEQFLHESCGNSILIFDDLNHKSNNFDLSDLFRVFTHHNRSTILFLQHNLFNTNFKEARNNAHVLILTSNFKNLNISSLLSRELFAYQGNLIGRALGYVISQRSPFDQLVLNLQVI